MAKLTVAVNQAKCIASGDCVETAPTVFGFNDDGKSEVIDQQAADQATVIAAARSCPVKAITVIDEENGQQLFPPKRV